jgi:hypothetical protein
MLKETKLPIQNFSKIRPAVAALKHAEENTRPDSPGVMSLWKQPATICPSPSVISYDLEHVAPLAMKAVQRLAAACLCPPSGPDKTFQGSLCLSFGGRGHGGLLRHKQANSMRDMMF